MTNEGNRTSLPIPPSRGGHLGTTQMTPHEYRDDLQPFPKKSSQTTPRSSLLRGPTSESLAKTAETLAFKRELVCEDVLLLWARGMVPLAIADELGISLTRTVKILQEVGAKIPSYLTISNPPKKSPDDVAELRKLRG